MKPNYNYKPSALNLFPHIGFINHKETYITQNAIHQRDVKDSPLGSDALDQKRYYHHREDEHNNYQNHHILTKPMLIERKYKNVGSKGNRAI